MSKIILIDAPPYAQNNFERNQKDQFRFKATDIGDVEKVVIRHDNWGLSPDWHLQQVGG